MNTPQRILYVEDETDIQTIARIALEMVGGFTLEVCDSGKEALERATTFEPDLILLDVMMPDMDGPSTLSALRSLQATQDTPVIFMTAKAQRSEINEYKAMGALDVIPKPFDPMLLADNIRSIWERSHVST
ncbi:MAG: response regulator [Pseudomonadota bacterium]